ncbi:xanthine/CO dehydrogenase XdhC/CoxF family maturation factor [Saonia flava]|uniref:Xanthine/CO dehydrogenase XdhC/CoxF family maturation factor n=1 Tax=Saonia flava TaxID=523696 RepID=A0A846QZ41_9FLAO|nr:XdhC/CoxI family protein [Saonia flava]NJB69869.1 xanthine/CO dehydrogenase XdhC/CoxF family maturation factor [Saonia flava]
MTHELKKIVQTYIKAQDSGLKAVLATVVALEGSSYRRPGVRMLIMENGTFVGAVSGGCVEKEVFRQSESVFKTGIPKIMTYDGRYRLGCEGILYILIEPFAPKNDFLEVFDKIIQERKSFKIASFFNQKDSMDAGYGSVFKFEKEHFNLQPNQTNKGFEAFEQKMEPCDKLIIIGAEHDAVQLCSYAALTGWEVTVVVTPMEEKDIAYFTGAKELIAASPEEYRPIIDEQTSVVLMTHSYVKDLKYLISLKETKPFYLGILGPSRRREKLLNEFLEYCPDISDVFFDNIHGPAGLDIGAETPQEIAISIMSEILSVLREKKPMKLKNKQGTIHS